MRKFNELAAGLRDTTVALRLDRTCPSRQARFCGAEGIENVTAASAFRSNFGDDYGVRLVDGKFEGLLARARRRVDATAPSLYTQLVPEIGQEPDYDAAVAALS